MPVALFDVRSVAQYAHGNSTRGAIPAQIDHALLNLSPGARQIKLYNSGSFFDPHGNSSADYAAIAQRANRFERVIVRIIPRSSGMLACASAICLRQARSRDGTGDSASGSSGRA